MSWFTKTFKGDGGNASSPENIIGFYQQLGFFTGADAPTLIQRYKEDYQQPPNSGKPWDNVFLLAYDEREVWADDPEADVCVENKVYLEVLSEWARISHGAFSPTNIVEHWETESGPITLRFQLAGQPLSVSPSYQDDWIDLDVLQQINRLIASSGRQFECAVDGNFALVLCLTPEQKRTLQTQRQFPFAW